MLKVKLEFNKCKWMKNDWIIFNFVTHHGISLIASGRKLDVLLDYAKSYHRLMMKQRTNFSILLIAFRTDPVDTGPKLNVHKTFRGRPGRLLNVLCTFNLRPVSAGASV